MSEKCKTCVHWVYASEGEGQRRGKCKMLPGFLEMRRLRKITVVENFGCVGHTPKPKEQIISQVSICYGVIAEEVQEKWSDEVTPEIRQAAAEFLTKPRDEQAGE